jgi:acyl-CoA thioesterase-1
MLRRHFIQAVLGAGLLAACGKNSKLPQVAAGKTVLAFGDSVTYGTGAGPGEDWPSLLAIASGWRMINAGVPGDTAEAAGGRIQELLETHRPALVILELGGNDFLRRRPQKSVKENLRQLIKAIRLSGAALVLVAVPELSLLSVVARQPSDAPIYAELAKEEQVPLISAVFADILARPELCADQIHPNAQGYVQMAAGFERQLKKIGLLG